MLNFDNVYNMIKYSKFREWSAFEIRMQLKVGRQWNTVIISFYAWQSDQGCRNVFRERGANMYPKGHFIKQKGTTVFKGHFVVNINYTRYCNETAWVCTTSLTRVWVQGHRQNYFPCMPLPERDDSETRFGNPDKCSYKYEQHIWVYKYEQHIWVITLNAVKLMNNEWSFSSRLTQYVVEQFQMVGNFSLLDISSSSVFSTDNIPFKFVWYRPLKQNASFTINPHKFQKLQIILHSKILYCASIHNYQPMVVHFIEQHTLLSVLLKFKNDLHHPHWPLRCLWHY